MQLMIMKMNRVEKKQTGVQFQMVREFKILMNIYMIRVHVVQVVPETFLFSLAMPGH